MVTYTIKDMEVLTGVKAHTIRIWEKRYELIKPNRTEGNQRYYSEKNLRRLLNVCFLCKKGYKISKIAKLSDREVKDIITEHKAIDLSDKDMIDTLMIFVLDFDTYHFNKILSEYINQIGMTRTMNELIYPLMDRLNMASISGSVRKVHSSYLIEQLISKLHTEISTIECQSLGSLHCMLYLPKRSTQELHIHYLNYLLQSNSYNVTNLGYEVSIDDVIIAHSSILPDYVITVMHESMSREDRGSYIIEIADAIRPSTLLITGYQTEDLIEEELENVIVFKKVEEVLNIIGIKKS